MKSDEDLDVKLQENNSIFFFGQKMAFGFYFLGEIRPVVCLTFHWLFIYCGSNQRKLCKLNLCKFHFSLVL